MDINIRKNLKFLVCSVLIVVLLCNFKYIYAEQSSDFWGQASSWFDQGKSTLNTPLPDVASEIINTLADMISFAGTTVFIIASMFLGVKYIYGTVEDKAVVKGQLETLLVAAVFFFGWASLKNVLYPGNEFILTSGTTSFSGILGRILSIVQYIANFFAIFGIIYIGVKYLLSGAQGKADIKAQSIYFIIGIIMALATVNFLSFLSKVINQIIG